MNTGNDMCRYETIPTYTYETGCSKYEVTSVRMKQYVYALFPLVPLFWESIPKLQGVRPNHQPIGESDPNQQGIWLCVCV